MSIERKLLRKTARLLMTVASIGVFTLGGLTSCIGPGLEPPGGGTQAAATPRGPTAADAAKHAGPEASATAGAPSRTTNGSAAPSGAAPVTPGTGTAPTLGTAGAAGASAAAMTAAPAAASAGQASQVGDGTSAADMDAGVEMAP